MWVDRNIKPKQDTPVKIDRSQLMNVPVEYDDDVERARTDPLLLPTPEDKPNLEIGHSKSTNSRRSVLGGGNNPSTASTFSSVPIGNKTKHNRIPVTKPNQVSWADRVRGNNTRTSLLQDTAGKGYFDTIGDYASKLISLS